MKTLKLTKKYDRYPKYKNSGVEWVGETPVDWEVGRVKQYFKRMERPVVPNSEVVTAFRDGTVTLRSNRREDGFTMSDKEIGYQGIEKGDLVVHAMDAFAGAIGVSDSDGKSTPVYSALRSLGDTDERYYMYLLRHMSKSQYIFALAKGIRERSTEFRYKELAGLVVPKPPLELQKKMAGYLDDKLSLIDTIIEKKKKQIELLREKRAAIINRAVTKGLDPNAKLVDSGIEWIGKIPEGWGTIDLGKILDYEQPGEYIATDISDTQDEHMVQVLTAGKGFVIGYTKEEIGVYEAPLPVIIFDDFTTGKQFVDKPFKVRSSALKILKVRDDARNDVRYIYRCMEVLDFQTLEHNRHWISMYRREHIPWPSHEQQKQIANMLDEQDKLFRNAATKIETTIILLQEFKSALISHVVTGKVKV